MPADLITCPYNPSHQIQPMKMMIHLVKCEKQYPHSNLKKCLFNQMHRIPPEEFENHKRTCPDKEKMANLFSCPPAAAPVVKKEEPRNEDVWEDNVETPKFKPTEAAKSKPVIRSNNGLTKAEKRKYREEERERISSFDQDPYNQY